MPTKKDLTKEAPKPKVARAAAARSAPSKFGGDYIDLSNARKAMKNPSGISLNHFRDATWRTGHDASFASFGSTAQNARDRVLETLKKYIEPKEKQIFKIHRRAAEMQGKAVYLKHLEQMFPGQPERVLKEFQNGIKNIHWSR